MKKKKYSLVIDTNAFISALRSNRGASYNWIFGVSREKFDQNVSPTLIFEYESVAKREAQKINLSHEQIDAILDMICAWSNKCEIFFLWRPFLKDPRDDFILELAIESNSDYIITYNKKDFANIEQFGLEAITPKEFLEIIGELSK